MTKSIMLVGVGGQGTILASKLLTIGLMSEGYDVKMSEIHGMSQRGGSVSSQVRYGEKVHSSVIERGGADILVAFEKVEAMRFLGHLKKGGKVVVNNFEMESVTTIIGLQDYPTGIIEELKEKVDVLSVNAGELAEELGNTKVMNVILLGTLVKSMKLENIDWDKIIEENVKPKFVELNKKAFRVGLNQA
ncbi:indolepyruvate oxidoreductase subunit beta [Clostridiaceae bacterium M8S5]|nr:indolepyruvate oxidoreductase subunit beta [Clostridiaceae bacterium M8S5]